MNSASPAGEVMLLRNEIESAVLPSDSLAVI
jgi:hypothetical protein